MPKVFLVLAALVAVILLGICAAAVLLDEGDGGAPAVADGQAGRVDGGGLIGRQSLDDIAAAGRLLRERPYQVSFRFRRATSLIRADTPAPVPARTLTWAGDLRSTGGDDPSWDATSQVTAQGTDGTELGVVDGLSVVDTGGVRYLDSAALDAGGRPWTATAGPDRGTFCWPAGAFQRAEGGVTPIPLPVVDPVEYLDVGAAPVTVESLPENATRYLLFSGGAPGTGQPGLVPGDRLAAAVHSLATATGVDIPEYTLAVTITEEAALAAVELTGTGRAHGMTLTMVVHSPGADVVVTAPPEDQVAR